jgi:hypothetical protein
VFGLFGTAKSDSIREGEIRHKLSIVRITLNLTADNFSHLPALHYVLNKDAGCLSSDLSDVLNGARSNPLKIWRREWERNSQSDISVHFVEADILHTGDTFWNRDYPFIDYWTGGSIDGQIRPAEANIAKVTDKTIVIPGHGAVGNRADLVLFRDVLVEIRDNVAALKKQGKSLPEVVAAKPGARYDAVWGNLFQNPSDFVALVYRGV